MPQHDATTASEHKTQTLEALQAKVARLEDEFAQLRASEVAAPTTVASTERPTGVSGKSIALFFVALTGISTVIALGMVGLGQLNQAPPSSAAAKFANGRSDLLGQSITQAIHECPGELEAGSSVLVKLRVKVDAKGAVSIADQEISPKDDKFVACVHRAATLPKVIGATPDEPELSIRYEIAPEPDGMRLVRFGWKSAR